MQASLDGALWGNLLPSVERVSGVAGEIAGIQAKVDDAEAGIVGAALDNQKDATMWALNYAKSLSDDIGQAADEAAAAKIATGKKELNDAVKAFGAKIDKPLKDLIAAGGGIGAQLAGSHFMDPKAPVYRWNWWHGYNNMYGWFQDNDNAPFGGVAPSQWVDNNAYAHQMNGDIKYLRRLFNKPGFGDKTGATACAENFYMPHSTDDRRCGVLFRIRNTNPGKTNWKVNWSFTGWCGWGNRASVAMNKKNIWGGCCTDGCSRDETFGLVPQGTTEKINTIVFVAGGASPHGHYNNMRTTYLMFNNLDLPSGIEFVDDIDSASGTWAL